MSRRAAVDYDDDYYDDGYYDDEEEDEEEEPHDPEASQYMWQPGADTGATSSAPSAAQTELLDSLAEEFRACLGDARIPKDQVDAVLVATDYDPEAALALLREQLVLADTERAHAASRLAAVQPSAVALMLEDQVERETPVLLPSVSSRREPEIGTETETVAFQFDKPSPDDRVQQKQQAGRARVTAVSAPQSKSVLRKPAGGVVTIGAAQPQRSSTTAGDTRSISGEAHGRPAGGQPVSDAPPKRKSEAVEVVAPKQRTRRVSVPSVEKLCASHPSISVVVAGHVDAGKSTLLGHFLQLVDAGSVSAQHGKSQRKPSGSRGKAGSGGRQRADSKPLAWGTDEDAVEQSRGVTIDIATRTFKSQKSRTVFSIIDAPGHRDYVPAMILGSSQATAALLVVDTSTGEFESGFSEEGQTREHAVLLRALGITRVIVVANKMDMVDFSEARFTEVKETMSSFLKSLGWRPDKEVVFVPTSGLSGINLVQKKMKGSSGLTSWYTGMTLLDALEALPVATPRTASAAMDGPTRLVVSDSYRSSSLGGVIAVSGRLVSGTVALKDNLRLCPTTEVASVKSIEVGSESRQGDNGIALAGVDNVPVSLGLEGVSETMVISPGDVLCDPQNPIPVVKRFRGKIVVIATPVPLVKGLQVELHLGGMCEAATVSKLVELSKGSGSSGGDAKRPKQLPRGSSGVVEVTMARAICVDVASSVRFLGRFALRCQGRTVAAGLVTELLKTKRSRESNTGEPGRERGIGTT